ncbi:hypothetical protein TRIATDRAFT_220527 [Trichoderma atroviride IMI 206040]|uniref:DUF7082 domain-containing protein n=2 Tax=Hypocrea atroviridis TaxID=63577 RepID=G9NXH5_HYPAI|nr:uncharacterized protein TRIATDRAFT_220527 [Trichoderma atroviride IMI 206040]EHK44783.1 hypothetical protein TRIATDRAFT_220527 [Trichoderma atroviride IMI 206040]
MTARWTEEEWINNRRIVKFEKFQDGEILNVDFKAVPVNEIPANSICISCIWWDTFSDCYLTHFDAMYLLEQLMGAPGRFSVERKNRLRRNLEGFHPVTISKTNPHNSGLFKTVMAFGYPRPRDIEGDFRVLPWNCLEPMLRKMIGKYKFIPFGIYNDIFRRERGQHADDTPVAFSKLPEILVDRPGISLPWLRYCVQHCEGFGCG